MWYDIILLEFSLVMWTMLSLILALYAKNRTKGKLKRKLKRNEKKLSSLPTILTVNDKLSLASIERIPPLISAKSQEVNQISKYFKNIKPANVSKQPQKLYV